jgi:MFS family permease
LPVTAFAIRAGGWRLGPARRNVLRLAIGQALGGANSTIVFATAAIVGHTLASDKALATLPISVFVVGMAACILPMGALARRHDGRAPCPP